MTHEDIETIVDQITSGDQRALARGISAIEDQSIGYRELVGELHNFAGDSHVIGITGTPGSGKSTLVERLTLAYRERGYQVGVLAIDPSSPFSGGAVLGDRVRMADAVTDPGVFVRSMSARGALGGIATATTDAIRVLSAAGFDRILVETVGTGQNEIDVVRATDTVCVLVTPGGGDIVQTLKAGILEIADLFVVNKADLDGADQTAADLEEMLQLESDTGTAIGSGDISIEEWRPPVLKTIATRGEGTESIIDTIEQHRAFLSESGQGSERRRRQHELELRRLLREELKALVDDRTKQQGGFDQLIEQITRRETDPYTVVEQLTADLDIDSQDE